MAAPPLNVLIPSCGRPTALAVTLTSLIGQTLAGFRVVVSDRTEDDDAAAHGEVQAVLRVLRVIGHAVEVYRHLPRRGLAEHRDFLLARACAAAALFLDDDVILRSRRCSSASSPRSARSAAASSGPR